MTNTKITDVEVIERRYPIVVRKFGIRAGSGGEGKWRGGDGVERVFEFKENGIIASIVSERRVFSPYGLEGGQPGTRGVNILRRKREDKECEDIYIGGKNSVEVGKGDQLVILTPGGGGYGMKSES